MKLGLILNDETTDKLIEISEYSNKQPYDMIVKAIDTMHRAMIKSDEE